MRSVPGADRGPRAGSPRGGGGCDRVMGWRPRPYRQLKPGRYRSGTDSMTCVATNYQGDGVQEMNENDQSLRDHLLSLLRGANAHISFEDFVADFPVKACGRKIEGLPYTAWQVLEHIRIAQWDILEFCCEAKHISPKWPKGYWPKPDELGNEELWKETVEKIRHDLK